jgi:protein-S-isoprenylcysteine O-methyltransferase Ste14
MMFEIYRVYLLLGLLAHKLVWEVMKRNSPEVSSPGSEDGFGVKTLVKWAKIAVLTFIIVQTIALPTILPIAENPQELRLVGLVIYTVGLTVAIVGRVQLGKNWANLEDFQVLNNQQLVRSGIYRHIRHPIYSGDVLLLLGLELSLNSWLVLMVIPLAIVVYKQVQAEEKLLINTFPDYSEYQRQTKKFIPFVI